VKNGGVIGADPFLTMTEPTFVARFLLDPATDTAETAANVDVFVDLADGSSWSLTIFTVDEVRRLVALWRETATSHAAAISGRPIR
jgi:hypothetical protein